MKQIGTGGQSSRVYKPVGVSSDYIESKGEVGIFSAKALKTIYHLQMFLRAPYLWATGMCLLARYLYLWDTEPCLLATDLCLLACDL